MNHRLFCVSAIALLTASSAYGQIFLSETYTFPVVSPSGIVPDDVGSIAFSETISGSQISNLTDVLVTISLSGALPGQGWAGDMYVSLNRDLGSQTAVLLNQVGVTASNAAGSSGNGWSITFQNGAPNGDIHFAIPAAPATIVTGTWQPDGRLNPTASDRPAGLGVFVGGTGNATWYLNLADLAPGGSMTLNSWSLTLEGTSPVPEPAESVLCFAIGLSVFALTHRRTRSKIQRSPTALA